MEKDLIQFAGDPALTAWLEGRATRTSQLFDPGTRVRTELNLWRGVLSEELRRQHWTLPELGLLADLHNGVIGSNAIPIDVGFVAHGVIDSFKADPGIYGDKWSVDEAALSKKVLNLGSAADLALFDAIARWWEAHAENSPEGWASVGIGCI